MWIDDSPAMNKHFDSPFTRPRLRAHELYPFCTISFQLDFYLWLSAVNGIQCRKLFCFTYLPEVCFTSHHHRVVYLRLVFARFSAASSFCIASNGKVVVIIYAFHRLLLIFISRFSLQTYRPPHSDFFPLRFVVIRWIIIYYYFSNHCPIVKCALFQTSITFVSTFQFKFFLFFSFLFFFFPLSPHQPLILESMTVHHHRMSVALFRQVRKMHWTI